VLSLSSFLSRLDQFNFQSAYCFTEPCIHIAHYGNKWSKWFGGCEASNGDSSYVEWIKVRVNIGRSTMVHVYKIYALLACNEIKVCPIRERYGGW